MRMIGSGAPVLHLPLEAGMAKRAGAARPLTLRVLGSVCVERGGDSLLLFGDVYAKAGDLAQAQMWYGLAGQLTGPGYRFQATVDDRLAHGAARVAAYLDDDPTNDPPVVGTGAEACASCHNR